MGSRAADVPQDRKRPLKTISGQWTAAPAKAAHKGKPATNIACMAGHLNREKGTRLELFTTGAAENADSLDISTAKN